AGNHQHAEPRLRQAGVAPQRIHRRDAATDREQQGERRIDDADQATEAQLGERVVGGLAMFARRDTAGERPGYTIAVAGDGPRLAPRQPQLGGEAPEDRENEEWRQPAHRREFNLQASPRGCRRPPGAHSCRLRPDGSGLRLPRRRPFMTKSKSEPQVVVSHNGPYLVSGGVPLAKQTIVTDSEGESQQWRQGETLPARESYQLCRCGKSK